MDSTQVIEKRPQLLGEEWIQTLVEKDYRRLGEICQADVRSRLMTPKRIDTYENLLDLTRKVEGWFLECSSFQKEQTRVAMLGEKLAIFYRLAFLKEGQPYRAEQQVYCTLREDLIDQVSLLCSGFQPVQSALETLIAQAVPHANAQPSSQADAILKVDPAAGQGSTCAILTPAIKRKLGEMNSGQVLEVQVDDSSAKEDIEAWCRLSGNSLLRSETGPGQVLRFYLMKK